MNSYNISQENEPKNENAKNQLEDFILFNKENLKKALVYLKDLKFDDAEFDKIYEKAKPLVQDKQFNQIIQKLTKQENVEDLETLLEKTTETLEPKELINLTKTIAENEDFLNYMQDLLLDKLL